MESNAFGHCLCTIFIEQGLYKNVLTEINHLGLYIDYSNMLTESWVIIFHWLFCRLTTEPVLLFSIHESQISSHISSLQKVLISFTVPTLGSVVIITSPIEPFFMLFDTRSVASFRTGHNWYLRIKITMLKFLNPFH
jgi:hypothetical protein